MTDIVINSEDVIVAVPQPSVPENAPPPKIGLVEINQIVQRGSMWLTGNGAPTVPGGQVGDMYLDVDTGDIYQWTGTDWTYEGTFAPTTLTPEEILAMMLTVDGAGSGLDADLLDGHDSPYFAKQTDMDTQTAKNADQDATLQNHETRITSNTNNISTVVDGQTPAAILAKLITVDGSGSGLDADTLDGHDTTYFAQATDNTAAAELAKMLTVDGASSGLDADLLDGQHGAYYLDFTNFTGILKPTSFNDTAHGVRGGGNLHATATPTVEGFMKDAPADGLGYMRKNGVWAPSTGGAHTDDAPPAGPLQDGQLWWKSSNGVLFIWYDDGNSQQWVQVTSGVGGMTDLDMQGYSIKNVKQLAVGTSATIHLDSNDTVGFFDGRVSTQMGVYSNAYYDGTNYKAIKAGWAHTLTLNANDGTIALARSSASLAAGANITFTPMLSFSAANLASLIGGLNTGGSIAVTGRMDATGNVTGAIIQASDYLAATGNIFSNVGTASLLFGLSRNAGGPTRQFQWNGSWYWDWHEGTGDMRYIQNGNVRTTWRTSDGALIHTVSATYKPGGGPWIDSSDERIKAVKGPYDRGLEHVVALNPIVYSFLGNDTAEPPANVGTADEEDDSHTEREVSVPYENSPHYQPALDGQTFVGLIAQEVEQVFPGMVTKRAGYIDGEPVDDIRDLDTTTLIFALVNSIKTLAARVEALEAR